MHFSTQGSTVNSGPAFPNYLDQQLSLQTGVIFDSVGFFRDFGDVITDARSSYGVVSSLDKLLHYRLSCECLCLMPCTACMHIFQGDTVTVEFRAGNPRNNLMVKTFTNTCTYT